jgi:hypothetical protein
MKGTESIELWEEIGGGGRPRWTVG